MILFRGEVLSLKTSADGHVRCRRCMSSDICIFLAERPTDFEFLGGNLFLEISDA